VRKQLGLILGYRVWAARTPPQGLHLIRVAAGLRGAGDADRDAARWGAAALGPRQSQGRVPAGDRAHQQAGTGWQHPCRAELRAVLTRREQRVFLREAPSSQG